MSEELFEKIIVSEKTSISLLEKIWSIVFGGWEDMPGVDLARPMLLEEMDELSDLQKKKIKRVILEDDDDDDEEVEE